MSFLANENFPLDAVESLRDAGFEVAWVRTDAPGMADTDVLAWAMREQRVLLTFHKDFGDLAFHAGLPANCGIVLFRISAKSSSALATTILASIQSRSDCAGHFSVIEPDSDACPPSLVRNVAISHRYPRKPAITELTSLNRTLEN